MCEIQAALSSETFAVVSRLWRLPSEQSAVKMLREHILEDANRKTGRKTGAIHLDSEIRRKTGAIHLDSEIRVVYGAANQFVSRRLRDAQSEADGDLCKG